MAHARRRPCSGPADASFARFVAGFHRTETRRGVDWTVQPISAQRAEKTYTCPGCHGPIAPGTAHVVVWRADGILGDAADLAARRHWHTACWRMF